MTSVVYPLKITKNIYDIVGSSFSKKQFVKINTLRDNTCIYDSFLLDTYKNYQEEENKESLRKIRHQFITEFKGYLTADSDMSNQDIYNKVFEAYNMIEMKDIYMLKPLNNNFDIFDLVIVKKDFSETDDKIKGYRLFSDKVKKHFSNVSNFFNLVSLDFLKEIIQQRIVRKAHLDKIKKLRLRDEDSREADELEEILEFMNRKENNLDLVSLYESVTLEDCDDQDLVLKLLSETLDINIFLCRGWNSEITVLKDYHKHDKNPYIIIFKGGGKTSITGTTTKKCYEAGGIKTNDGIKTILTPKDEKVISDLRKMLENDIESYFLEKYNKYLKNIEQKSRLDKLENYYDATSEEELEDEIEETETVEEDRKDVPDIPAFIRGYSRGELQTLLNLFVNPEYDYSETDKTDMELQYKNYLEDQEKE